MDEDGERVRYLRAVAGAAHDVAVPSWRRTPRVVDGDDRGAMDAVVRPRMGRAMVEWPASGEWFLRAGVRYAARACAEDAAGNRSCARAPALFTAPAWQPEPPLGPLWPYRLAFGGGEPEQEPVVGPPPPPEERIWRSCGCASGTFVAPCSAMKSLSKTKVSIPELALIAGTRVMLGGGIGLLLANRLRDPQRRAVGWTLFAVGAATTIPLAMQVMGRRRAALKAAEEERTDLTTGQRLPQP